MIDVLLATVTDVAAAPPKVTAAPVAKPDPAIVTAALPVAGPAFGVTLATAGAGAGPASAGESVPPQLTVADARRRASAVRGRIRSMRWSLFVD
jgi:hypothetical protein